MILKRPDVIGFINRLFGKSKPHINPPPDDVITPPVRSNEPSRILRDDGSTYALVYRKDGQLIIKPADAGDFQVVLDEKCIPQLIDILKDLRHVV